MVYVIILIAEFVALFFISRRVIRQIFRFFYQVTRRRNWGMYLFAILFLPGTFIHEISHFLAALFLLVPVGELELIPRFKEEGGGVDLGSVAIAKTDPIRRFLIGVAPFIFGVLIIFTILYLVSSDRFIEVWWGNLVAGFLIFEIANSMFASKKDLEGALILLVYLVFVAVLLFLLGVKVPNLSDLTFSEPFTEILQMANLFLLVPIFIDTVVLLLIQEKKL